jgi:hypothetical protein
MSRRRARCRAAKARGPEKGDGFARGSRTDWRMHHAFGSRHVIRFDSDAPAPALAVPVSQRRRALVGLSL